MVVFIFGLLRLGYSPIRQHISELGEVSAPNAIVFNIAGFLLLGLPLTVLSFSNAITLGALGVRSLRAT